MKNTFAIILAAGRGTRMKSATAKVLHPLLGRPMISYPVSAAKEAGVEKTVIVVGHQASEVEKALYGEGVCLALQPEQLGTADAVAKARPALGEASGTALILCGDVPLLRAETVKGLLLAHDKSGAKVTVLTMEPDDPTGYGRIVRDEDGSIRAIVEERDADAGTRKINEVNSGAYAVSLPWLWGALALIGGRNSQRELYLTDIVAAAGGEAMVLKLADAGEAMGINSRAQLAEATAVLRSRINRHWMDEGVTLEEPSSTWIEPGVVLAPDVTLGPQTRLEGKTMIGRGSRIGMGSVIRDSVLGEEVVVKPYCVITEACLERCAQAGPFAHLRPGARIGEKARVGNFVEVKKSTLGPGVKANHLTYIGDAEIGEGTNVGAGTITCNYDGKDKFKTVIGKRTFIGSNTSLVAPVTVGDDAVIGAGSTITGDVEEGALGVARARQRNIRGWKRRKSGPGAQ